MNEVQEPGARPMPLHRVRFVDWSPSSITALAFSPTAPAAGGAAHQAHTPRCVLAIGRENGNIDLCTWCEDAAAESTSGAPLAKGWMVETTLFGDVNYKIEALAFTKSTIDGAERLRLFSTSGGSIVTEHYLPWSIACVTEGGKRHDVQSATRTLSSGGGAIWSMAASPLNQYLAIGCEDGVVRLIDVTGDAFEHVHGARIRAANGEMADAPRMARVASRILSLAWGPPRRATRPAPRRTHDSDSDSDSEEEEDEEIWREGFLLGGLGNSTAAVWDVESGQLRSRLTVMKNRSEHTIVWAVAVLGDGTLVTGDSTGRVTFFDARTRVPISGATFQCHTGGADVLSLCVSSDGRTVYSAGVDQKVAEYSLVGHTWAHTATRRLHAHDIRALAVDPPFDIQRASTSAIVPTRLPVLVSGGIDFHLVLTPAAPQRGPPFANPISSSASTRFADTTQRRVPFVPQNARAGVAGGAVVKMCDARRWIVLRRDTSVAIWALSDDAERPWHKLCELELRTRSNLVEATVSPDGAYLAVSDLYETKLFALSPSDDGLQPRRVKGLGAAIHGTDAPAPGASVLVFTPDSTRLILGTLHGAFVHLVQLPALGELQLLRSFTQHRQRYTPEEGRGGRVLAGAKSAKDREALARDVFATIVLALVSPDGQWLVSVDNVRRMHVFHLDTLSHQRVLASPASLPTSAVFHPQHPNVLAVTLPTNQVAFYDLEGGRTGAWEQELRTQLDTQLAKVREPVVGSAWLPGAVKEEATLVLYGPTWICTARHRATPAAGGTKRRSEAPAAHDVWSVRTTFKYQPLLSVHALLRPEAELLVIERPYFALAQSLPPSFYRGAKYGF